jgi:hypothetical protein
MARRKDPDREQAKRLAREAELERDAIHELLFVRKDWKYGDPESNKYFTPVRAVGDPKKNQYALDSAIAEFQRQHGVADWRDITADYEIRSYWYG